jgi:hypothetical protein
VILPPLEHHAGGAIAAMACLYSPMLAQVFKLLISSSSLSAMGYPRSVHILVTRQHLPS